MTIYQDCDTGKYYLDDWRECDKMGNLKMTREEAIKKLVDAKVLHPNIGGTYILLDALEALGLIKFDEPDVDKKLSAAITSARMYTESTITQLAFINHLKDHGYKIERI